MSGTINIWHTCQNGEDLSEQVCVLHLCGGIPSLMGFSDDRIARGGSCWNPMTAATRGGRCFDDFKLFLSCPTCNFQSCWSGLVVTRMST